jgi:hypothetical protein
VEVLVHRQGLVAAVVYYNDKCLVGEKYHGSLEECQCCLDEVGFW